MQERLSLKMKTPPCAFRGATLASAAAGMTNLPLHTLRLDSEAISSDRTATNVQSGQASGAKLYACGTMVHADSVARLWAALQTIPGALGDRTWSGVPVLAQWGLEYRSNMPYNLLNSTPLLVGCRKLSKSSYTQFYTWTQVGTTLYSDSHGSP